MTTTENVRAHLAPEAGEGASSYVDPLDIGDAILEVYDDHEPRIASLEASGNVGTSDLADSAVTTAKIADSAVTSAKIADGTIATADLADLAVTAAKIAAGAVSPDKAAGAWAAKTANYTAAAADSIIAADTTGGAFTITLPAASGATGKMVRIIKVAAAANTLTIGRTGSDTISGKTSVQFPAADRGELLVASDGTNWQVISGQASDENVGRRIWEWSQALGASGTGATVGWQLVHGDTGVRNVTALLANGWTCGANVYLARSGSQCSLYWESNLVGTSATSAYYMLPISGFNPGGGTSYGVVVKSDNTPRDTYFDGTAGFGVDSYGNGTYKQGRLIWRTGDAWPSTLPGTASGSIPA